MPAPRKHCPWPDAEALVAAIHAAGGVRTLARQLQVAENTIRGWLHAYDATYTASRPISPIQLADGEDAWALAALTAFGANATVEAIADHADVSPKRVRDALERLEHAGYRVNIDASNVVLDKVPPAPSDQIHPASLELFDGDTVKFAIVSDTHLKSKECRLGELNAAYDLIQAEGISTVYHPGDLVCGSGIYRHQIRDIDGSPTLESQVAYAVDTYPQRSGVTTRIIAGNHDLEGDFGRIGANPVIAVANQREDIEYCGDYSAWFELPNGAFIHVLHPMGGASYATSYKLQKLAESYEAGRKPAMLICGHWHRSGCFWARSIFCMHAGTFEGSTALAKRLGLGEPHVGFWIVEATLAADASLVRIRPEWIPLYVGRRIAA